MTHVEDAQPGVPHRRHHEGRVLRVVDVVVVDGVVLLVVDLGLAVLRLVDLCCVPVATLCLALVRQVLS